MIVKALRGSSLATIYFFSLFSGCSSYNIKPDMTAEQRLALAKTMFKNEDYREAKTQFKILTLNNPGATFTDEAQFLLAECHFREKEFILAADEYARLMRLYPQSRWVDDAQFRVGLCDYRLSPKAALDQKYTLQAVAHFQRFLEDFPNSDLVPEAEKMLLECRTKLAKKEFKSGELYRKFSDYYAALVYFDSVLGSYYDTEWAEPSLYWRAECLYKLQRKREALDTFNELLLKYPKSRFRTRANERRKDIESELAKSQETDGKGTLSSQTKN